MEPSADPFAALRPSPEQGGMSKPAPVLSYTHDAMIDEIIRDPKANTAALARRFGRSYTWTSQVISSDAFQTRLAARREEIVDPVLVATVEEKMHALARVAADRLLEADLTPEQAIGALKEARQALGLGVKANGPTIQNFVAVVPPKSANYDEWLATHSPQTAEGRSAPIERLAPHPSFIPPGSTFAEVVVPENSPDEN